MFERGGRGGGGMKRPTQIGRATYKNRPTDNLYTDDDMPSRAVRPGNKLEETPRLPSAKPPPRDVLEIPIAGHPAAKQVSRETSNQYHDTPHHARGNESTDFSIDQSQP